MKTLLTAYWTNLLAATFEADETLLNKFLPRGTELNTWHGKYLISIVAFMFSKPAILNISAPFYRSFEEINLRFYVRYKENDQWKKGVVFIKEIAPARIIGLTAGWLYQENFIYLPLKHKFYANNKCQYISYSCKVKNQWGHLNMVCSSKDNEPGSERVQTFVRDHYWGYTKKSNNNTAEFLIEHRLWKIYQATDYDLNLNIGEIYGKDFTDLFLQKPISVILMDGSFTKVSWPTLL